jgi:hypothetical protein
MLSICQGSGLVEGDGVFAQPDKYDMHSVIEGIGIIRVAEIDV